METLQGSESYSVSQAMILREVMIFARINQE